MRWVITSAISSNLFQFFIGSSCSSLNRTVTKELLEMSQKALEKSKMSELAWSSKILRTEIAPAADGKNVSSRIRDCAIALRWKISRVHGVWYEDERVSIKPKELRQIERISGLHYGKQELNELDDLITKADALLYGTDADFTSAFTHALREVARAAYRAGTQKRN